jgi:hypothetical protein
MGHPDPVHFEVGRNFKFGYVPRFLVDMDQMQDSSVFSGQVDGMRKSGPGVLRKVRAEENVLVGYHAALLSGVQKH